jgi:hypothetical protein
VNHNEQLDFEIHTKLEQLAERLKNDQLTADELATLSRQFFADAQRPNPHLAGGYDLKLRFTLQAQFFQAEAARKRSEEQAEKKDKRDNTRYWVGLGIELGVALLIGIEIYLSIHYGRIAIREGREQARVLQNMEASSAQTATAMNQATAELKRLADEQKKAADRLQEMSDNIQVSTGAARNQLRILKEEQADTHAQRSKKPRLTFVLDGTEIDPRNTTFILSPHHQTETSASLDALLSNHGDATAHSLVFRVVVTTDESVGLVADGASVAAVSRDMPEMSGTHTYLIRLERLLPGVNHVFPLTFTFPRQHKKRFAIHVSVDSEETPTSTTLAQLWIELNDSSSPSSK